MSVSYRGERMNGNMPFSLFNGMGDKKKRERKRLIAEENYIKNPERKIHPKKETLSITICMCLCFCSVKREREREKLISREV